MGRAPRRACSARGARRAPDATRMPHASERRRTLEAFATCARLSRGEVLWPRARARSPRSRDASNLQGFPAKKRTRGAGGSTLFGVTDGRVFSTPKRNPPNGQLDHAIRYSREIFFSPDPERPRSEMALVEPSDERDLFISAKLELKLELELPKFWAKLELELQFDLQFWVLSSSFGRSTGPIFVEKRDISRKSARFPTTKRAMSETVPETEPTQEVVPRTMVTCGEWSGESAHSRPCVHKPYRVGVKKRPQVVLTWQPARELQFELQFWNCELQFDLQFDLQFCAYKSHHARSLAALGGSVDCAHFENRRFRSPRRNLTAAAES